MFVTLSLLVNGRSTRYHQKNFQDERVISDFHNQSRRVWRVLQPKRMSSVTEVTCYQRRHQYQIECNDDRMYTTINTAKCPLICSEPKPKLSYAFCERNDYTQLCSRPQKQQKQQGKHVRRRQVRKEQFALKTAAAAYSDPANPY
jgi:hypothetical protein